MTLDPARTVAELRELAALTSDERGAQRLAWTPTWARARAWLVDKLAELPVEVTTDAAGNAWATLPGRSPRALVLGSHLDSVPNGGWLDGCLGVVAGLAVLRRYASAAEPPALTVRLVDWTDEEGARFGRSLLGSSAASGALDPDLVRCLVDADGVALPDALAAHGVELDRMRDARAELESAAAYLELHIEQGPVLESLDLPLGIVTGTVGVERHVVAFAGQAAHAGTTPTALRRDALLSAARLALEVRDLARRAGGTGTTGRLDAVPGIATAVAGEATLLVDQRHEDAAALQAAAAGLRASAEAIAADEGTTVALRSLFATEPVAFDPGLIGLAEATVAEVAGRSHRLPSGALHDATEVARAGVPTAMLFVQSLRGLSHTSVEDTRVEHLELAVRALDGLADRVLAAVARGPHDGV